MNKSVLISIQKPHTDNIIALKKTNEVRKGKPNQSTPFPCYIYETKNNGGCGKVIGVFVCEKIEEIRCCCVPYKKESNLGYEHFIDNGVYKVDLKMQLDDDGIVFERNDRYIDTMLKNKDFEQMCLKPQELYDYVGLGKEFYLWHISQLKIYDKPKELSEFKTTTPCKQAYYFDIDGEIGWYCKDGYTKDAVIDKEKDEEECIYFDCPPCGGESNEYEDYAYCLCNGYKPLKRPPQSWCYVKSLEE